jgi:signal transduction histidine kinase
MGLSIVLLFFISFLIYFVQKRHTQKIKSAQEEFQLISHMHSAYVITDRGGLILDYNKEFIDLVEDEEPKAKKFINYLSDDSIKDYRFYLKKNKNERFECTLNMYTSSFNRKPVIAISTLATNHVQKDARITILIESEIFESTVADKYADRISHILKTPLHSILMIASQLRKKSAEKRYDEYYKLLDMEIESLRTEISRLLKISRTEIKSVKPIFEKIDLSKLIKTIEKELRPLYSKKKLTFKVNIAHGIEIVADRSMVRAAIENILENAYKYTIIGSISLEVSENADSVYIVTKDTGIGIPPNEIKDVFKKSFRGKHPVVLQNPGQGIGLYQCKNFVELNNGKIDVDSKVEKGTTFTITLPKNINKRKGA